MLEPDLLRSINSGRCFALVGAGASSEMGYPSWGQLAAKVRDRVLADVPSADPDTYGNFLSKGDFPALFREAECDLGSREAVVELVKDILAQAPRTGQHRVYDHLARWPFACYLTTNYDDELKRALARTGQHFSVVQNTTTDLAHLRDGISHLIVKLHADLDHPDQLVLTSLDYDRIITNTEGQPFRDKVRQVFEMFSVLVIGHSMSDPDLRLILATAKHTASPLHPIYMIVANATRGQVREFREQYNIHLLTYRDSDGRHHQLRRMLAVADNFVCARDTAHASGPPVDEEELQAATSLFLHRRMQALASDEPITELLGPLILGILSSTESGMTASEILTHQRVASLAQSSALAGAVSTALDHLNATGHISRKGDAFVLSASGCDIVNTASRERSLLEDQALGQFEIDFRQAFPQASHDDCSDARTAVRNALVATFGNRGLAMANVIVAGQSLRSDELHSVFREISKHANCFSDFDKKAAFIDAAHHFLVEPSDPQQNYLAAVSQGYFLYHLAGRDPTCATTRRTIFEQTCWLLDSSVLIPFLAVGSHNHVYAVDLFEKLRAVNAQIYTTGRLFREVWQHLDWALAFVKRVSVDTPEFMSAALSQEGYKQNLFIDGYVRLAAEGAVGTFAEYVQNVIGPAISQQDFERKCADVGVVVLNIDELPGFTQNDWGDIESLKDDLEGERRSRGTFRGAHQVMAEAEVLVLIRKLRDGQYELPLQVKSVERVYFVSQSRALDMVSEPKDVVTWTPEAVYRYVSSLSKVSLDPHLLQQCMLHEYFFAGVSFIDRSRYTKYFGPAIDQARLDYRDQRERYLAETEQAFRGDELDAAFDRTPDLDKPFFVAQMGWQLARAAEEKAERVTAQAEDSRQAAERRVKSFQSQAKTAIERAEKAESQAEADRKARAHAETEANRLRNLQDPKHQRKRNRQAKKRRKRKKR